MATLTGIDGRFGHKACVNLRGQFQHFVQLLGSAGVVHIVQATGYGQLHQRMFRCQCISHATGLIGRVGCGQKLAFDALK